MRRHDNHKYKEAISYQTNGSTRVDPHDLAKYFQSSDIRAKAAKLADIDESFLFGNQVPGMVQIKGNHILVECRLNSGLPLIVRVPLAYYEGIGARFVVSKREGSPLICLLELVHKDPGLTIPVMASTDLEDAAVDWKSWSRRFHLAMLHQPLGSEDGYVPARIKGEALSDLIKKTQQPRRPHAQFAARRPRFLVRRKVGLQGAMPALSGREIIART